MAAVTAVLAAAAALLGVPAAGHPGLGVAGLATTTAARAAGTVCVGIVVDPAQLGGSTTRTCVTVAAGSTGTDALYARAKTLGRPAPRFDSSGLLCAIDGVPATGCGDGDGAGGYSYWSYWRQRAGTTSWSYSRRGPGFITVARGDLEGWRWSAGGPEGRTPPPAASSRTVCPPTTGPGPARTPAASPAHSSVAPPPSAPAPTTAAPRAVTSSTAPVDRGSEAPPRSASPGPHAATGGASSAATPAPAATSPATTPTGANPSGTSSSPLPSTAGPTGTPAAGSVVLGDPGPGADGGAGSAVSTLIGLLVVAVVAGGGVLLVRRRRVGR